MTRLTIHGMRILISLHHLTFTFMEYSLPTNRLPLFFTLTHGIISSPIRISARLQIREILTIRYNSHSFELIDSLLKIIPQNTQSLTLLITPANNIFHLSYTSCSAILIPVQKLILCFPLFTSNPPNHQYDIVFPITSLWILQVFILISKKKIQVQVVSHRYLPTLLKSFKTWISVCHN